MPKDDENDRVFDVSKPSKVSPSATSKPIIVGHHPMISDPMVKEDKDERPALPKTGHKTIQIQSEPSDDKDSKKPEEPTKSEEPAEPAEPTEPKEHSDDVSATLAPAVTPVMAQPQHPESVEAVATPSSEAAKPTSESAAGELHLTSLDDLIGHEHHSHEHASSDHHDHSQINQAAPAHKSGPKKGKKSTWLLLALMVLVAGYLVIDSRLIKTSIKLPFHVFKQPAPAEAPVATSTESTNSISTAPATGLTAYKLATLADKAVSFDYPTDWGTPIATSDPGFSSRSTSAKSDGTHAYLVNFSTNKLVEVAVTSGKYLPASRGVLYYDYLQWCVGTNDGKFYKSLLHSSTSAGVDTPSTTTCDQGPLTDATKLNSSTIVQLKTPNPDGSILGDLYTMNLNDQLNLPVLRVRDIAMTNGADIKDLLASVKLVDNQAASASQ